MFCVGSDTVFSREGGGVGRQEVADVGGTRPEHTADPVAFCLLLNLFRNPSSDLVFGWYSGSLTADSDKHERAREREK